MKIHHTLKLSSSLELGNTIAELRAKGEKIISLGLGEPEFNTPDNIKEAAITAIRDGHTRYAAANGLPELRELVAQKLKNDNRIDALASEIMIVPGAKNALFLALAAILEPGDEIINFTPCYVSNIPLIYLAEPQCTAINIDMKKEDFSIDINEFKAKVTDKTKAVLLNFPNNPTGVIMKQADVKEITEFCISKNIIIISDEIYEPVYFSDEPFVSPAQFDTEGQNVITINGFSKSYSMTGWRIGYLHTKNKELLQVILRIHQQINTNTPVFTQYAAIEGLKNNSETLINFKKDLKFRAQYVYDKINSAKNVSIVRSTGGIFGFMNISKTGMNSDKFCVEFLKAQKVAILAGNAFGDNFDDHCRISLVNTNELIIEGVDRLLEFVNQL